MPKVILNIEDYWISDHNGKRVMTIDDYDEMLCTICKDDEGSHEIGFLDNTYMVVCEDCAKIFMSSIIGNDEYTDRIDITRL